MCGTCSSTFTYPFYERPKTNKKQTQPIYLEPTTQLKTEKWYQSMQIERERGKEKERERMKGRKKKMAHLTKKPAFLRQCFSHTS